MPDPNARALPLIATLLLPLALLLAGCPQPPAIGNPCAVGSPGGGSSQEVTISTAALECESRICLQVGDGQALCSGGCGSDDDCVNLSPAADHLCPHGFTCQAASPFEPHACERLCLCRDSQPPAGVCGATP